MKPNRLISFITLLALCVLPIALRGQVLSPPASAKPISEDLKLFAAPSSLSAAGKAGWLAFDATYFYVYNPTTRLWVQLGGGGAGVTDGDKGDIVVSGTGASWVLDTSGASAGSYTYAAITVDAKGRITTVANGTNPLNADNISSGILADARIASTIARDSEVTSAVSAAIAASITNGVTTSAPNQDQVFDALALKVAAAGGTLTAGVLAGATDLPGTINRSSLDTITITTNAGVVDVTKGDGSATNGAATTLTFSTDNVAATRYLTRTLINSDGSNARVFTFDTATDFTVTVPASSSVVVSMKSQGASGWARIGGASNVVDLSATSGTPATTKLIETVNPTTGASEKTTIAQVLAASSSRLGSHTTPDTSAGSITWTSMMYAVYTNTTSTYTLPAASGYDGRAVIFYVTGTNAITIDPNASEVIVRAGTAQTGGVTLTLTGAAGNYVALLCDGTRWITYGYVGTLAAGS